MSLTAFTRLYSANKTLSWILILAIGLRCILLPLPIAHHADEIWQYLEPAYGLVTGKWVMAWEFHAGIRTWLIPIVLAVPMSIGHAVAPDTGLHLILVHITLAAASLFIIFVFYQLCSSISRTHAIIAAFAAASWFELVYFSSRALSDAIEVSLAFPAILTLHQLRARPSFRVGLVAGALLALCFSVRFQLAPALLLLAIWGCGSRVRSAWIPLIAGGVAGLCFDAVADLCVGQTPFLWIVRNFEINLLQGKSATFGTEPWYWYITEICHTWGYAAALIIPLSLLGARRFPALLFTSLLIIGLHSAIPHKEYRFVLFGIQLLVLLAAIGTADLVLWLKSRQEKIGLDALTGVACSVWLLMSLSGAATSTFRDNWGNGVSAARALRTAGHVPGLCGFAIYKPKSSPSAAYVSFNRPAPIYLFVGSSAHVDELRNSPAFNVVETPLRFGPELGPAYHLVSCSQKPSPRRQISFCIFVRPGSCAPGDTNFSYNTKLTALGK